MDLRQLRCFLAVAETLSYEEGAARVYMSPHPVYKHVRRLREQVGAPLFIRRKGVLELTVAGEVLLKEAKQGLSHLERAVALARQAASGELELSIGYNSVAEHSVFSDIISAFRKLRPNVNLVCRSLRTPEQVQALERNELDLGFVCPPVPSNTLDTIVLTRQPFVAVVPENHPLAARPAVSFQALSGVPMIVCSRALDPRAFERLEQEFRNANATLNVSCEMESVQAMIRLVAAGCGCCIVPEYARELLCAGVVCKVLDPPNMMRVLAVATQKGREGLAQAFCEFAVLHVNELNVTPLPRREVQRPALAAAASGEKVRARR